MKEELQKIKNEFRTWISGRILTHQEVADWWLIKLCDKVCDPNSKDKHVTNMSHLSNNGTNSDPNCIWKGEEKCGQMILTPNPLHNGGMWCNEDRPCKYHDIVPTDTKESWEEQFDKFTDAWKCRPEFKSFIRTLLFQKEVEIRKATIKEIDNFWLSLNLSNSNPRREAELNKFGLYMQRISLSDNKGE